MHAQHPPHPLHAHVTPSATAQSNETRTRLVVALTAVMMGIEIVVGTLTGSVALAADGWHMATHVGALGFTALAYWYARAQAKNEAYSFGTGKVYALSGFTSALLLLVVAVWMVVEAGARLVTPTPVAFAEALPVAVVGLVVNLVSAALLHAGGSHGHAGHEHDRHDHDHGHDHHHHAHDDHAHEDHHHAHARADAHVDHNMRAAYAHVLADALTSVAAIAALVVGHFFAWTFFDPLAAIVSSLVIAKWSVGLLRQTVAPLLDAAPSDTLPRAIRARLEAFDDTRVVDLHLWELGLGQKGCIVSLVTGAPKELSTYREAVLEVAQIAHLTVEIERCHGCPA